VAVEDGEPVAQSHETAAGGRRAADAVVTHGALERVACDARRDRGAVARACSDTLVSASATTKYAVASIVGGSRPTETTRVAALGPQPERSWRSRRGPAALGRFELR
jgi:hypothetical protein